MTFPVALVKFEQPLDSVRRAVDLSCGFDRLPARGRVFIKPNIVFWTRSVPFPKWGVITTSRVVADMVVLLKERGIDAITIGEGIVARAPGDEETPAHAFQSLGYGALRRRFGVKCLNVFARPFISVDLGDGFRLKFSVDAIESDFIVNLPVIKTHNQTVVSLGIKNLKGLIDLASRKRCHSMQPDRDLHAWVARLADRMPPMFTLLDGIYTNERGPGFDGRMHRTNLLVGSADVLSADLVGAAVLGYPADRVPHLAVAARRRGRPLDLSDIDLRGVAIEAVARPHAFDFQYDESADGVMPAPLARDGLKGLFYRKYDLSLCTYCSAVNGVVLSAIRQAWQGQPWSRVEVLTGKHMQPSPGMEKTILIGRCMVNAHRENPVIREMIAVKGCPPKPADLLKALRRAGIEADAGVFDHLDRLPGVFMGRYAGRPEFEEGHFRVDDERVRSSDENAAV